MYITLITFGPLSSLPQTQIIHLYFHIVLRTCVCFGATKDKKDLGKFNMLSPLIWQYAFFSFGKLHGEVHKGITFLNCCFL